MTSGVWRLARAILPRAPPASSLFGRAGGGTIVGNWALMLVAGFVLTAGAPAAAAPAAAMPPDAQAKLEQAGRLSEMAARSAEAGDRGSAITIGRKALKLVDDALAAGADPA